MMVLRQFRGGHLGAQSVDCGSDEGDESCPIDLSAKNKKNLSSSPSPPTLINNNNNISSSSVKDNGGLNLRLNSIENEEYFERRQKGFIPLSRIQARFAHQRGGVAVEEEGPEGPFTQNNDPVESKRARLDCLISHIKQSKDEKDSPCSGNEGEEDEEENEEGEIGRGYKLKGDPFDFEGWKNKSAVEMMLKKQLLSPSDSGQIYEGGGGDPYTQQMLQLHLTQAAMMGDSAGLLKAMGQYPPWLYLGYYSQLIQSFQTQEILRQYALNSHPPPPPHMSQGEKSPSGALGNSSVYNCQSPLSPHSLLSEGGGGADSDSGSNMGQNAPGSTNGKRAPRAMTGRHVRTGTGASPATLQTLRLKIEERQRNKAQGSARSFPPSGPKKQPSSKKSKK